MHIIPINKKRVNYHVNSLQLRGTKDRKLILEQIVVAKNIEDELIALFDKIKILMAKIYSMNSIEQIRFVVSEEIEKIHIDLTFMQILHQENDIMLMMIIPYFAELNARMTEKYFPRDVYVTLRNMESCIFAGYIELANCYYAQNIVIVRQFISQFFQDHAIPNITFGECVSMLLAITIEKPIYKYVSGYPIKSLEDIDELKRITL